MEWQKTRFPGCEAKTLLFDRETGLVTALMRFAPGAVLPDHEHVKIEQTYVLEGRLVDKEGPAAGLDVGPGEFVWREAGSRHVAWVPGRRADARDVPDPEQVPRARRPRDRRRRPGLGERLGPLLLGNRSAGSNPAAATKPVSDLCMAKINAARPRANWQVVYWKQVDSQKGSGMSKCLKTFRQTA